MDLSQKHCVPCEGGVPPFSEKEIAEYAPRVPEWEVKENKKIEREFKFRDFNEAMGFVNAVAKIAEEENHHPNIAISYNRVTLELWTHAIGGLSENDFILAAKIDKIPRSY